MLFYEGEAYASASAPQRRQGSILINMLDLSGDELVLDVGCGPGLVALNLLRKYPRIRLHGIDISPEMIKVANRFKHDLAQDRLSFEVIDLFDYEPENPYDLTFSSSAMHWAIPADIAYEKLHRFTKPAGVLAVHQGGKGTYGGYHEAALEVAEYFDLSALFEGWSYPTYYPTDTELEALLSETGFTEIRITSQKQMLEEDDFSAEAFAYSGLLPYLDRVPDNQRGLFRQEFMRHAVRTVQSVFHHRLYVIAKAGEPPSPRPDRSAANRNLPADVTGPR